MAHTFQPLDQTLSLWAVTPLARCDREADWQAKGVNGRVYFSGQAAF